MGTTKRSFDCDPFAEKACKSLKQLKIGLRLLGLPGLTAMIRIFVKSNWNDRTQLAQLISSLSGVYSVEFIDQFIKHLTGRNPYIHVLYERDNGELLLIEEALF